MTDPIRTPDVGPPRGPHPPRAEPTRVVSSGDAKQGRKGLRTFTVLMVSLVLLIVAAGILLTWQQVALRDEPPRQTSPATR